MIPRKWDDTNQTEIAATLRAAGVRVAILSDISGGCRIFL